MNITDVIESYQKRGKYTFTKDEALEDSNVSEGAFHNAVSRLQKKSRLIQPKQGFFVIVRLEEQDAGGPPPSHFIDQLMDYLDRPYYVGVLSAASLHGASHQSPQVFQVLTRKPLDDVEEGRARIQFIENKHLAKAPVETMKVRTGYMTVSTIEATLVDVVYYRKHAGGLNNAPNVIIELVESKQVDSVKLFEASVQMHDTATVQRLGYLLETFGYERLAGPLASWIQNQDVSRIPLASGGPRSGVPHNKRWHVLENNEIQPDVKPQQKSRMKQE